MANNFNLEALVRNNIRTLEPYSSARSDFDKTDKEYIYLDANENSYGSVLGNGFNRYPDPLQKKVRKKIAKMKLIDPAQVFLGHGSDEAVDLLFRVFCRPALDRVIICPPTYGMYQVSAAINEAGIVEVPLDAGFDLDVNAILGNVDPSTKLIFACSPNNPTGNCMSKDRMVQILENFNGLLVVDEAYIDFTDHEKSMVKEISNYPNLVILQTFSKAWGLAGLRAGMAIASPEIVKLMDSVKPPYNMNQSCINLLGRAVEERHMLKRMVKEINEQREYLISELKNISCVRKIFPSEANFILFQVDDAEERYNQLLYNGFVLRDRSNLVGCDQCLRLTVGTDEDNKQLVRCLKTWNAIDEMFESS